MMQGKTDGFFVVKANPSLMKDLKESFEPIIVQCGKNIQKSKVFKKYENENHRLIGYLNNVYTQMEQIKKYSGLQSQNFQHSQKLGANQISKTTYISKATYTTYTDKESKHSEFEYTEEDIEQKNQESSMAITKQQSHKPSVCFRNLAILLCFIMVSLIFAGVYFTVYGDTNTNDVINQKQKQLKQPRRIKNICGIGGSQMIENLIYQAKRIANRNSIQVKNKVTEIKADPQEDFSIYISEFPHFEINGEDIKNYGIQKDIQIGSIYDYLNITYSSQFKRFKEGWNRSIAATIYQFQYPSNLEERTPILGCTHFKDQNQMQTYLRQLNQWNSQQNYGPDLALYLGSHLLWKSDDAKLREIELYYFQKKYQISKYTDELPICLFSTGYKIASRQRHVNFLKSISRQNYSNYHIVAVDDNSPDGTAKKMYDYLNGTDDIIKNRIKIVKNHKNLGATLSTYYWSRRLCNPNDIIVHVDMDDSLIGRQVFKVINAIYHDPNIWYAYSRYIIQWSSAQMPNAGKSLPINIKMQDYRHVIDWKTSAMRTLRYEVMNNVPVEHLVEYHYDEKSKKLSPKFYDTDADRFLIYSQLELSGEQRIRFVNDAFYYYNTSYSLAGKCNMRHEHFDQYKSRIKTGVMPMANLSDTTITFYDQQKYQIPKNITENLKDRYSKYQACLNSP